MSDTIDINVNKIVETIEINATPNVVQININSINGDAEWGEIHGVLSDQTDLQQALDLKADTSDLGDVAFSNDYNDLDNLPTIITNHSGLNLDDGTNPHGTTKSDVGLGNVDNTSDIDKPISTATQQALDLKANAIDLDNLVPYTGATQNVDLGEFELKAGQVEFDTTPTGNAGVGILRWNDSDGTLDLGLKGGNVTLQIGQEQVVRVVNKTGFNLLESNYQAVRVNGAQGQRLKVDLAQATNDLLSAETIGLVTENIDNNQEGFVTTSGLIRGINTTGSLQGETWADGDILYLSPSVAGRITNIKPSAPNHLIVVGYVVYAHANNGSIFVKVDNGYELEELHNVTETNYATPIDADSLLTFDVTNSLWKRLSWANIKSNLKTYFDTIYQTALGFIPENVANKATNLTSPDNTKYPTTLAVSTALNDKLNTKVDKVAGKDLSTNDFTNDLKTKLDGIQDGAEVNVNADWSATSGDSLILNKPTIPSIEGLATEIYVDNGLATKQNTLGFTPENVANKANDLTSPDNTKYPTTLAVSTALSGKQDTLTNPITGTGTLNFVSKFTSTGSTLGDSQIFDNGSGVGIGTTTPNYTTSGRGVLDVNGGSQSMVALSVGGVGKGFLFYTGTDLLVSNESNGAIKLNTNGSEKAIITSNGNVGIGTSSPGTLLSLYKTSYPVLTIDSGTVAGNMGIDTANNFLNVGTTSSHPLVFASNNTERMRITSGGNVGIGTSSPLTTLQVVGSFKANGLSNTNLEVASSAIVGTFDDNGFQINSTNSKFGTYGSGVELGVNSIKDGRVVFENSIGNKFGLQEGDNLLVTDNGLIQDTVVPSDATTPVKWIRINDLAAGVEFLIPVYV